MPRLVTCRLGDVLSRLTGDVATIEKFVLSGLADTISFVLRIAFFTAALFYLQWSLALVSLLVIPLFVFAARRFSELIQDASREERRRTGSSAAIAERACPTPPSSRPTTGRGPSSSATSARTGRHSRPL